MNGRPWTPDDDARLLTLRAAGLLLRAIALQLDHAESTVEKHWRRVRPAPPSARGGPDRPQCRHCHDRPAMPQKRGLCWRCHREPATRALYPSTSKFTNHGTGNGCIAAPLPEWPTRTRPGSEDRIRVYAERAEAGEALFHPDDLTIEE